MSDPGARRREMVERQIAARGVTDERVLAAMAAVPREAFIPDELAEFAYEDAPLPIAEGQTISQPYIVALMTAALELAPGDRVLEVGAGSGYAAAVLGSWRQRSTPSSATRRWPTSRRAAARGAGLRNVHVLHGDGSRAGRSMRRTTPSSSPPAARRCRGRCSSSWRSAAGW